MKPIPPHKIKSLNEFFNSEFFLSDLKERRQEGGSRRKLSYYINYAYNIERWQLG